MEIKGIKYIAPMLDGSGYAQAARGNIMALYQKGVPLTLSPISFEAARPDLGTDGKVLKSLVNKEIDYNIVIMHMTPEFYEKYREADKINLAYTIWETDKLHPKWPPYINDNVDKVLVGCEWNVGVFKNSGVTKPIGVVPHGINMDSFKDIKQFGINGLAEDDFVFYDIMQWVERKNPLAVIKAYWYAFQSPKDKVVLVLKTYRSDYSDQEKDAIKRTIRRLKQVTPADYYPKVLLILNMLSDEEMLGLHKRGNCYASLDRGEGFGLCIAGNTKILVPDGIRLAKDIKINDEVLSIDGKFHKILNTSSKHIKDGIKISVKLHENIIVSKDHPFLVAKHLTRHKRYNNSSKQLEKLLSWEKADNIFIDDYIAIPKPKLKNICIDIDIASFVPNNVIVKNDTLYCKMGFSPKNTKNSYTELTKKYGYSKKIFEGAVKHIKNNTVPIDTSKTYKAYNILKNIGYEIKEPNCIKRYIKLTDNVLNLFGWYLAEGSTNNDNFLEMDFHKNEYNVALFLSEIFKNEFNIKKEFIYLEKYSNKSRIIVSNRILAMLFSNMFGKGARNKHIPDWLFKCGHKLMPLLKGLFSGDGHDDSTTYTLTTVSDGLAYQAKTLLNGFGFCSRINKKIKGPLGNYDQYSVGIANNDYCIFTSKKIVREKKFFIETNNFFLVKVYNIERVLYNNLMYDFSVEDAKSFVGNGLLLHNCSFTAGAVGNPIIVTGFGGVTEYAKPDNSYLVNYTKTPVFGMPYTPWYRVDQLWAESDILDCANKMRYVYENQKEAKKKGLKLQEHIRNNFSWEVIGNKIIKEIEML